MKEENHKKKKKKKHCTLSCMISQTKLRSAMEGRRVPRIKRLFSFSQRESIFAREADRSFSASAAAAGFLGKPSAGASAVFRTNEAECRRIFQTSISKIILLTDCNNI